MQFEWDENKNSQNIIKHGISFDDAKNIFSGFTVDIFDNRFDYGEIREVSIGLMDGVAVLAVVHTDRQGTCRIISARPALKKERKIYDKELRKSFDS